MMLLVGGLLFGSVFTADPIAIGFALIRIICENSRASQFEQSENISNDY